MRLVFIHGAGCTSEVFTEQRDAFPQALAYALPGHERAGSPDRIDAFASALLDELEGDGPFVLCGHSMGGAIALDAALRRDPRIAGIVLLASGAKLRVGPAIFASLENDFDAATRQLPAYFYADATTERIARSAQMMQRVGQAQTVRDFRACDAFDVLERLGEIAVPLLAVTGDSDVMTPPKFALALTDRVSGAQARIIEGAGHSVMLERPAETNALIRAFVDQITSQTP
jgi:pimeloyl-ACP methyl ester carboxylesterase